MEKKEVELHLKNVQLKGEILLPQHPKGIVIFSHGSGSSRLSPRNRFVAGHIARHNFITMLFDLLTEDEDRIYDNRFDIALLSARLNDATDWIKQEIDMRKLPVGFFGASTGAASALNAAAEKKDLVKAVVCRGGRPDLALENLGNVKAATLLIVGGLDPVVIELNHEALNKLECPKRIEIIPGATHLFEEKGKLEEVAALATKWYEKYLAK